MRYVVKEGQEDGGGGGGGRKEVLCVLFPTSPDGRWLQVCPLLIQYLLYQVGSLRDNKIIIIIVFTVCVLRT